MGGGGGDGSRGGRSDQGRALRPTALRSGEPADEDEDGDRQHERQHREAIAALGLALAVLGGERRQGVSQQDVRHRVFAEHDGDETDDCPSGPNCPECGDGADNDLDGDIDYPADIGCRSANGDTELDCSSETDPLVVINTATYSGTTVGAHNDQTPTCGSSSHTAPSATSGSVDVRLSMRSRMPPWPGRMLPLSLRPA